MLSAAGSTLESDGARGLRDVATALTAYTASHPEVRATVSHVLRSLAYRVNIFAHSYHRDEGCRCLLHMYEKAPVYVPDDVSYFRGCRCSTSVPTAPVQWPNLVLVLTNTPSACCVKRYAAAVVRTCRRLCPYGKAQTSSHRYAHPLPLFVLFYCFTASRYNIIIAYVCLFVCLIVLLLHSFTLQQ